MLKSALHIVAVALVLPLSCMLSICPLASPAYGDDQPPKERSRQRDGDRQSRGSKAGETAKSGAATTEAKASARRGRQGDGASSSTRTQEASGRLGAASGTAKDRDADTRPTMERVSPEQQANVQQLQADLQVLAGGVRGAEDEIKELADDLQAMSVHSPDPALVEGLAADLAAAVADGTLTPREMAELATAVEAVLQSAGLSPAEVAVLIDDVEAILLAAGVGRAEVQAVVHDLQNIVAAAPSSPAKTPSKSSSRRRGRGRS